MKLFYTLIFLIFMGIILVPCIIIGLIAAVIKFFTGYDLTGSRPVQFLLIRPLNHLDSLINQKDKNDEW